jgi:hypothetical protein
VKLSVPQDVAVKGIQSIAWAGPGKLNTHIHTYTHTMQQRKRRSCAVYGPHIYIHTYTYPPLLTHTHTHTYPHTHTLPGLLAAATEEKIVRCFDLAADESYNLSMNNALGKLLYILFILIYYYLTM